MRRRGPSHDLLSARHVATPATVLVAVTAEGGGGGGGGDDAIPVSLAAALPPRTVTA